LAIIVCLRDCKSNFKIIDREPSGAWGLESGWLPLEANNTESACEFYELKLNNIKPAIDPFIKRRSFWKNLLPNVS